MFRNLITIQKMYSFFNSVAMDLNGVGPILSYSPVPCHGGVFHGYGELVPAKILLCE